MKKNLLFSFSQLFSVEIIGLLIPFILYPFLVNKLGIKEYSNVIYTQNIISYFIFFVQFGFNLTATRDISIGKDFSNTYSSVQTIKTIIFLISLLILYITYKTLHLDKYLLLALSLLILSEVFNNQWFYQGIEKLKVYSTVTLTGKLVLIPLTVCFIKTPYDYINYAILLSITTLIPNIVLFYRAISEYNLTFKINSKHLKSMLTEGFSFFFSRSSVVIAEKSAITMLGVSGASALAIAQYDLAIKLTNLLQVPFNIFNKIYYPYSLRKNDTTSTIKVIIYLFALSFIFYLISLLLAKDFIMLYTGDSSLEASVKIYSILAISVCINVISHNIGSSVLIANKKNRDFNVSVISGSIIYITIVSLLYISENISPTALAISSVIFPTYVATYRVICSIKLIKSLRV